MMSYLQNVLQRHQLGSSSQPVSNAGLQESFIVQPRPQSRFENDQGVFAQNQEGRNDKILRTTTADAELDLPPARPLPQSPTAVQPATINDDLGPGQGRYEGINERIDTVTLSCAQKSFEYQPFIHTPANQQSVQRPVQQKAFGDDAPTTATAASADAHQSFPQAAQPIEPRRVVSQEPAPHQHSQDQVEDNNELNQRIDTVLQTFNSPQTHTARHKNTPEPRQPITITSAAQNRSESDDFGQPVQAVLPGSNTQPAHADEPRSSIAPAANRVLPKAEVEPHLGLIGQTQISEATSAFAEPAQQREPTGSLQIPGWLADMQTELYNRWRELNQQAEPEPVVNVTIGRVEIRAVQDKPAKQAQARNKPSGVMTLDAYLKQRDHRGQA